MLWQSVIIYSVAVCFISCTPERKTDQTEETATDQTEEATIETNNLPEIFNTPGEKKLPEKNVSTPQSERHIQKEWYEGGTLHRLKISDWKEANEANKLATCGDIMAVVNNRVSMSELKRRAEELKTCIHTSTNGLSSTDGYDVADVAALCIKLMGYQ